MAIHNGSPFRIPAIVCTDSPDLFSKVYDGQVFPATLEAGSTAVTHYTIPDTPCGELTLPGLHIAMSDFHGLFRIEVFVEAPTTIAVLPALIPKRGRQRGWKRWNTLPPPGLHRHLRPGHGGELLDLRDYAPGDPLKAIAWKPTARRDRPITREFESEVPVRCRLFLDVSNGVRIGPRGQTTLARFADLAASILHAANDQRDHLGLVTFDAESFAFSTFARTQPQSLRLLRRIAGHCNRPPDVPEDRPDLLVPLMHARLRKRHHTLLDRRDNALPWSMFWRPLLDTRWGWLIFVPLLATPLLVTQSAWLNAAARNARDFKPGRGSVFVDAMVFLLAFTLIATLPSVLAGLYWLVHGSSGFLKSRRRAFGLRKQTAAVFAALDHDTPAAIERYLRDDDAYARRAGRWLRDEGQAIPTRRLAADGRDRFREPEKLQQLSAALTRAIAAARDNELFIVLADLVDYIDDLTPFIDACRLANSRRHRVMVVVPTAEDAHFDGLTPEIQKAFEEGQHRRREALRHALAKASVKLHELGHGDPLPTVLGELDRARGMAVRS
jgi:uncharacterized protein (DUF58 family)